MPETKQSPEIEATPQPGPDPIEIVYDMNDLTFGEVDELEKATGIPWWDITKQLYVRAPSAALLAAVAWIYIRRERPDFTLEEARAMKTARVLWLLPARPAPAAGKEGRGKAATAAGRPSQR